MKTQLAQRAGGLRAAGDHAAAAKRFDELRAAPIALGKVQKAPQTFACEPDYVLESPGDEPFAPGFGLAGVVEIKDLHERAAHGGGAFCLEQLCEEIEFPAFRHQDRQSVERACHVTPPRRTLQRWPPAAS